ncbi:MAG: methyltransferase domain-containing protein [Planctomycetaceae bacterium]|jgi:SAM-dependent methyltransferase|nr:methyltransferase domain-containing protein [Planctomycetaceae bacterium]
MTDSNTLSRLMAVSSSYQEASVLHTAADFDLATKILERKPPVASASELAKSLQLDLRALSMLLDALAALGYFVKTADARHSVAEPFVELLDSRHPATFIPMLRHMGNCMRDWSQLARVVTEGQSQPKQCSILGAEEDNVSFILAMNSVARVFVSPLITDMKNNGVLDFGKENIRFIDIGGASGTYTKAFLEALPQSTGTIFDLPVAIREARQRFAGTPLESRVSFAEGDFYKNDLPNGFDFAWISAIIHQFGRAESQALYAKAHRALNPGGRIAVRDYVMEPNRTAPSLGALFGINMLVHTATGKVYTYDEIRTDLEAAGFINVTLAVPAATMSAVVTAEKAK